MASQEVASVEESDIQLLVPVVDYLAEALMLGGSWDWGSRNFYLL